MGSAVGKELRCPSSKLRSCSPFSVLPASRIEQTWPVLRRAAVCQVLLPTQVQMRNRRILVCPTLQCLLAFSQGDGSPPSYVCRTLCFVRVGVKIDPSNCLHLEESP